MPYWIIINELTLGETSKLIINLDKVHMQNILENCVNYFTNVKLGKDALNTSEYKEKYSNNEKIKMDLVSLNKQIKSMQSEMKILLKENSKNNDCLKYTHFLFDKSYAKYTGIDKKYFDKLKNN